MLKNLKEPPFTVFGIVRFFKMNNFCLRIRFSQAQHSISDFFVKTCFFSFCLICFHRNPPQFLLETKRFASIKDCSRFLALCDLPETNFYFEKFRKKIPQFFCFLKGFRLRMMSFLLFPVGEEWFLRFMRIPLGIFGAVKLMKL